MRKLFLLALIGVLVFLVLDSATTSYRPFSSDHGGWTVRLFGTRMPAEWFVVGLIVALWVLFPRRQKQPRKEVPPADPVGSDLETMREVSQMLDRMERRIESLETILLDREGRAKRTAEHE
jgi:hypothetical protein